MSPGGPLAQIEGERGWEKSQGPAGMRKRSRGREPPGQAEADRGPPGVRALASPRASDTDLRGDLHSAGRQWSGPKGPEAGTAKRRCFYEKERKRPDRCRGSLLRRRPDLAQDAETCLGGRVVTKSLKPVQKCVAGTGELYYQSQHILRRKKFFFPFSGTFEIFHNKMGGENI